MRTASSTATALRLLLHGATAEDIMTASPISISEGSTVGEARAFLGEKGFGCAPVIDEAGRPVGVLSHSDIVVHDREAAGGVDPTRVRDIMTPVVLAASPETPTMRVIQDMLGHKVHHLFVVDRAGVVIGVISSLDILGRLREDE